jgi:hypothetical protein
VDDGAEVLYTFEVPAARLTVRGLDVIARVETANEGAFFAPSGASPDAPRHVQTRVTHAALAALPQAFVDALPVRRYRMVSVPADLGAGGRGTDDVVRVFEDDYGEYNTARWRLLRFDPALGTGGDYREAGGDDFAALPEDAALTPGAAYWLITNDGAAFDFDAAEDTPDAAIGRSTLGDAPFALTLQPGFNQIATPFAYDVAWTPQGVDGLDPSVVQVPVRYDPEAGEFVPPSLGTTPVLRPFEGYFVNNTSDEPVTVRVRPVQAGQAGARVAARPRDGDASKEGRDERAEASVVGTPSFALGLRAQTEGRTPLHDTHNSIGFAPDAQPGRDRYDLGEAPPIDARGVRLSVVETGGPRGPRRLARSFRPEPVDGATWDLEVATTGTDATQTVRVQLRQMLEDNAAGRLPRGFQVYMLDLDRRTLLARHATVTDATPPVRVKVKPDAARRLRLIVGTEAYANAHSDAIALETFETKLLPSYPNPFQQSATIEYRLAERTHVTLEVYNVLGQRVRRLESAVREAGPHTVRWHGRDDFGQPVASGVYFYRLRAGDLVATKRMTLVR